MAERVHLLIVNPTATANLTEGLKCMKLSSSVRADYLDGSGLELCPPCIENTTDSINSAAALLPRVKEWLQNADRTDGILVCCFSDHPLVHSLRENVEIPVMGIFHASLQAAWMVDHKFGIVTTVKAWEPILEASVTAAGMQDRSIGVVATGLGVLELESKPRDEVEQRIKECALPLIAKGAKCIILGCAGMVPLEKVLREVLPTNVELIDGVRFGVYLLEGLSKARRFT